jgi:plasmid stabilization system protein ParE
LAWGTAAGAVPQVSLKETSHDFGKVFEDAALTYTFGVENTGTGPLEILEVDPDCDCTASRYDRRIPPGGKGEITLTIQPYSVIWGFKKDTKVRFNDPARTQVVLTLKGTAQPFIEIKPSHIIRLKGTGEDDLRGQVRFISHLAGPWEIKDYRTNIPEKIDVSLKAEEAGRVYLLEVRNKYREAGRYKGEVELFTTSKERPRLIVRVFADLYPAASGNP